MNLHTYPLTQASRRCSREAGASLIEVLVAILVLSFGMLSLAAMLAYSVQLPKLSAHRSTAMQLAASHVERMRANPSQFSDTTKYTPTISYNGSSRNLSAPTEICTYPNCTPGNIADSDIAYINWKLDSELPAGGILVERDTTAGTTDGNLWVMWNEPANFGALGLEGSDNCPTQIESYTDPRPRCIYVRFKL